MCGAAELPHEILCKNHVGQCGQDGCATSDAASIEHALVQSVLRDVTCPLREVTVLRAVK